VEFYVAARALAPFQIPALSPLEERVDRTGVFFSRGGPGEGVFSLNRPRSRGYE